MNRAGSRRKRSSILLLLVCAAAVVVTAVPVVAQTDGEEGKSKKTYKEKARDLPLRWKLWLDEEVYPLMSKEQRQAFLSLETEAQRKAFVERLLSAGDLTSFDHHVLTLEDVRDRR